MRRLTLTEREDDRLPAPWLVVIGIGEDGSDGLSPVARTFIRTAPTILGSARHLKHVATLIPTNAARLLWTELETTINIIKTYRNKRIIVLASGDPMLYGLGATLTRHFSTAEMIVVPHISAFSLAAARLGWPLQEVETLTVHGRPIENIAFHFSSGVRLLVLSADGETPSHAAALLTAHGFGPSSMIVLEHIGGPAERHISGRADCWENHKIANLNIIAIECSGSRGLSRGAGLPDEAYYHDGQLTKREVRAVTLAALAPCPGELLWDIGAGAGSIAIEWLRTHHTTTAVAVEQDITRVSIISLNAFRLGVPRLQIAHSRAPACLTSLPGPPAAVFVGGNVSTPGILERCWEALPNGGKGGRLIVNAVTIEAEARLMAWQRQHGGTLVRLSVARLRQMGPLSVWDPLTPLTQYQGWKTA